MMKIQGVEKQQDGKFIVKVLFELDPTKMGFIEAKPRIEIPNVNNYDVAVSRALGVKDRAQIRTVQFVPFVPKVYFTEEAM